MFGEIVGQISCSRLSKNVIMSMVYYILYPIKAHIHGFGVFFMNFVADNFFCSEVFCIHGCGRLGMSRFLQGDYYCLVTFGVV